MLRQSPTQRSLIPIAIHGTAALLSLCPPRAMQAIFRPAMRVSQRNVHNEH